VTGDVEIEGFTLRYDCDRAALGAELGARFLPLSFDAESETFVRGALAAPHGWLATTSYAILRAVLSDYDAYALLGMYPMHLCSAAQFRALLPNAGTSAKSRRLLDVGAGSGAITAAAASAGFGEVLVTEASRVLRAQLRRRGYRVLDCDLGSEELPVELRVDVALCLNVLDRTSYPRTMLAHVRDAQLLEPLGLRVHTLSRVPYVCRGDHITRLYVLDAALFVCGL
jgi:hypothetical protein